jgi:hypothetical protein
MMIVSSCFTRSILSITHHINSHLHAYYEISIVVIIKKKKLQYQTHGQVIKMLLALIEKIKMNK